MPINIPFTLDGTPEQGEPPVIPFNDKPEDAEGGLSLTHPEQNVPVLQKMGLLQKPAPGEEDPYLLTMQKKVAQVVPILKGTTGGALQAVGEMFSAPDQGPNIYEDQGGKNNVRGLGQNIANYGINLRRQAAGEAQQLEPNIEPGTPKAFLGDVAGTTARMVPSILSGIVSGAVTANPAIGANVGLAVMFPDLFGEMYGKQRDKGMDPDRALLDALASATQNTLLEKVPLHVIFGHHGGALSAIMKTAGAEGLTEYVQSGIDDLIEQGVLHGDMTAHQALDRLMQPDVQKDLMYQAAIGAVSGGLFGGGAHMAGVTNPMATPPDTVPPSPDIVKRAETLSPTFVENKETSPSFDAIRLGEIDKGGAHFSEKGPSTYFDPENPDTKAYKYSRDINIADTSQPEVRNALVDDALKNEKYSFAEQERLAEVRANTPSYLEVEELGLGEAAKRLGFDGIRFMENDDIGHPTTVNVWNLDKVKEVPKENFAPSISDWSKVTPDDVETLTDDQARGIVLDATTARQNPLSPVKDMAYESAHQQVVDASQTQYNQAGEKLRVVGFDTYTGKGRAASVGWERGTADTVYKTVDAWKQRFAPHIKLIVSSGEPEIAAAVASQYKAQMQKNFQHSKGFMYRHADGTWNIVLNRDNLAGSSFESMFQQDNKQIYTTLAHEFGHVIAYDMLSRAPKSVQDSVVQAYKDWHNFAFTDSLGKLIEGKFNPAGSERWLEYTGALYGLDRNNLSPYRILQKYGREAVHNMSYLLSFDEWLADQFARFASSPKQGLSLAERFFTRVAAYLKQFYKSLSIGKFEADAGYVRFLKHISEQRYEDFMARDNPGVKVARDFTTLHSFIPNIPYAIKTMWNNGGKTDRFNAAMSQLYTVRQIAQLNPHIQGLQQFMAGLEAMSVTKNDVLHRAEERLVEMSNLGKERLNNVGKFLLEETVDGNFFDLGDPQILKKYGLDVQAVDAIKKVKDDFAHVLNEIERVLSADIVARYLHNPAQMQVESQKLATQMKRMRSVPYFPLARFGNYTVVTRAKNDIVLDGRQYKKGSVIDMRTFPNEIEQKAGHKEAIDDYKGEDVSVGMDYLEDSTFAFQGIPPQVFEALERELNLSARQIEQLNEYRTDNAPGKSFLKHLKKRNKTLGYSEDAERAYADYMLRSGNHLARISHYKVLNEAKTNVSTSATDIQTKGGDATNRRKIHEYMAKTYDYVMNPEAEWASLRSLAFQWHLGFNLKSAFVNLTQIPLSTFPLLSQDHGEVKATAALVRAMRNAYNVWKDPNAIPPDMRRALQMATDAGIVNQSFATMVAGIAEGHSLQRVLPGSRGAKMLRDGAYLTSWMFQKAELINRRTTFLAAFDLAKQKGMPFDQAYEYAKNMVQDTQGEYSKWNRPQLFRGKKGIFFVFKSYTQFMMFNYLHSRARVRYLAMMGLMGGLLGLPLAEDLFDLFDWAMSWGEKKWDTRREIRELLAQLTSKPDLIMHGLARESFGLAGLAHAIGVPFPKIDLSGSLSMGRVIPGWQGIMQPGKLNDRLQRAGNDTAGAAIAIPLQIASVMVEWDRNPDKARLLERALPPAIKNVARAWRWGTEGGDKDPRGALRVPMSWQDSEQRAEIVASAFGFQPTTVNAKREEQEMFKRHAEFYMLRQQLLLQDFAYAYMLKDREGLADVRNEIRLYNSQVPEASLRINSSVLRSAVKDRMRNVQKLQHGIPLEGKKYTGLYREIDRLFPDENLEMQLLRNQSIAPTLPFTEED